VPAPPAGTLAAGGEPGSAASAADASGALLLCDANDNLGPVDLKRHETLVGVERRKVLVSAGLHELDDAKPLREIDVELLSHPTELRTKQAACGCLGCGGEPALDRRTDRVEVPCLRRHECGPFGAITRVMLRPSRIAVPSA
jgi:hypothetical protein